MNNKPKLKYLILPIALGLIVGLLYHKFSLGLAIFGIFLIPAIIRVYIPYAQDNPKHLWFKRKIFGWGWTPVRWQGWIAILIYVLAITKIFLWADARSHSGSDTLYGSFIPILILTAALIALCYWKGEKPRWQWGQEK